MERTDELSARPRVLLLLLVLAALAGAFAFETIRAGRSPTGSSAPPTGSSVVPPGTEVPFEITESVSGLAPGLTREIEVTLANPNAVPGGGSVTVSGYPRTPTLAFRNLEVDQDDART